MSNHRKTFTLCSFWFSQFLQHLWVSRGGWDYFCKCLQTLALWWTPCKHGRWFLLVLLFSLRHHGWKLLNTSPGQSACHTLPVPNRTLLGDFLYVTLTAHGAIVYLSLQWPWFLCFPSNLPSRHVTKHTLVSSSKICISFGHIGIKMLARLVQLRTKDSIFY